jgi:photosystem II stability/assembly factor-like uncharacterized protein
MTDVITYLSPNGQNTTRGEGPATRLLVATVEGVATLGREDAGAPWRLFGRSLTDRHVGALMFEPTSGKLFASAHADGGLWVSDDGEGRDWRPLTNGLDRPHVYTVAARRVGDRVTLFAGTEPAALYRSDDLGESWTEVTSLREVPGTEKWTFPPPPHLAHVKNVVFHPGQPETIYALVEQGALLKSVDDGKSWVELSTYSHPDDAVYRDTHRLIISDNDHDLFYLATGAGLYRSGDGGGSWDRLTSRDDRVSYPDFLFFHPGDDATLYLAGAHYDPGQWFANPLADSVIMRSADRGRNWAELGHGLPKPVVGAFEAMTLHRWDGGMMLAIATATGEVYASEDAGDSWICIADDMAPVSKDHHHIAFMPPDERDRAMASRRA